VDADRDPFLERVARELRADQLSASVDFRIMAAVRETGRGRWMQLLSPRRVFIRPLPWSLAATAALLVAGIFGAQVARVDEPSEAALVGDALTPPHVQFVLISPSAKKVSVVGDFNAWDRSAETYQASHRGGGVWTVTAPVPPGHHRYSFVVDDTMWVADPNAPAASDNDFGVPKSALVVTGGK
jgi:hypothetical protein